MFGLGDDILPQAKRSTFISIVPYKAYIFGSKDESDPDVGGCELEQFYFNFLSNWIIYDCGDSIPFDFKPN